MLSHSVGVVPNHFGVCIVSRSCVMIICVFIGYEHNILLHFKRRKFQGYGICFVYAPLKHNKNYSIRIRLDLHNRLYLYQSPPLLILHYSLSISSYLNKFALSRHQVSICTWLLSLAF